MADTNRLEPASNPPRTSEKTIVIVPTYNERENLPALLKDISAHLPGAGILVVDDSSPDGTGELAEGMKNEYPNLSVLHRAEKTGLADAYREAFRHALALGADYVITMDADLSHDPRYLPDIVRGFTKADVVVGSRYTRGISIVNWPLSRLMLSHFGNWYARTVTSLKIRDCTSGFVSTGISYPLTTYSWVRTARTRNPTPLP